MTEKNTQQRSKYDRRKSVPYLREARQTRLLKTLLVMAIVYTLYLAQSLFIPLVFSALVALLLSPLIHIARKFFIPRPISAFILMAVLATPFGFLGVELAEPAERWMHSLPKIAGEVTDEIEEISKTFENGQQQAKPKEEESDSFFSWFEDEEPEPTETEKEENTVTGKLKQSGMEMLLTALAGAPLLLAQIFGSVILILFLLVYGPAVFRVVIRDFPMVTNKRRALVLVHQIQTRLSNYILTISMINACLGLATAVVFVFLEVDDALLWGALVALLNFVPYLGGLISFSILVLAGAVQYGLVAMAFFPAVVFLCINILEAQFVTPAILGKSMRVNPLVIIIWLSIMGWLWGVIGVLLAVPILVCYKIILENLGVLPHWVKLIESG